MRVGLELEEQIQDVHKQQYDRSTTTDFQDCSVCLVRVAERGMKRSL